MATAGALWAGRQIDIATDWAVLAVALTPFSVVAATGAVVGLLAVGARKSAAVGAVVLAFAAATQVGAYVPVDRTAAERLVTVMTANLLHGRADAGALLATVESQDVGILATQELTQEAVDRLTAAGIDGMLPYRSLAPAPLGAGVGIWSRYPLTELARPSGFGFTPVQATVAVGERSVTIMSFHSKAPLYNGGTAQWATDLDRLAQLIPSLHEPAIIAGDFNATRDHRQFRDLLTGGYTDAASDAGAGVLPTFPTDRAVGPVASLDHVVLSSELIGLDVQAVDQPGSDHRAVIATIAAVDGRPSPGLRRR